MNIRFRYNESCSCEKSCVNKRYEKSVAKMLNCTESSHRTNLTQEQLGERIGVKRAQISRLEKGYSITIPTMRRVFKALGVVTATIDLGIAGKVALW